MLSAYDSVGNRLSLTYPGGRVLTYAYDVLDQCTNITETGASLASFSYAGPGRVARVIYGNGTRTQITYDGARRDAERRRRFRPRTNPKRDPRDSRCGRSAKFCRRESEMGSQRKQNPAHRHDLRAGDSANE